MNTGNRIAVCGFTLIELLVTLAVSVILLSVGIPGFRNLIMDNRLVSETNQFVTSIQLARSAAIRYQRNAIICVSADYDAPTPSCSAGTDWSNGWIVWVDKDRDAATDTNEVLAVFAPLAATSTFSSITVNSFTYDPLGFINAGDDLTLCDNRSGEKGRLVRVNSVGRTNVSAQNCG